MYKKQQFKNKSNLQDLSQQQQQQHHQQQLLKESEDKKQKLFSAAIQKQPQHHSIQSLPDNTINKKKQNPRKVVSDENIVTHCSCCPFYKPNKQRIQLDKLAKQILFLEDDYETYQLHKQQFNEKNKSSSKSEGVYFSKNELEVINQGPLPKQISSVSKTNSDIYQQQQNAQILQQQQYNGYLQNRFQGEEEDLAQKRKSFFLNATHNRTNSYDSYAQPASKQWLEQISEEREEQESQLTFQNKHLTHANSSQNLRSENRYLMTSHRNSIGNNGNGSNTRRSSMSGGDNERSQTSLYSVQNQKGFQHSQQNTPQISVIAPSQASSSTYMPQQSLNVIDYYQNNSEFSSNQQLSLVDQQTNPEQLIWHTQRRKNQHFRSQSCPYSLPYFKQSGQNQQIDEGNQQNGLNMRVMTIHEEDPYHNYVNTSNYQCSSNNSTRNKYRQQQPYRQNTNYRSASGGDYSHTNFYQNTQQTPNTIVLEKNQQLYTNSSQLPFTNTPFCFEHTNVTSSNPQADENQYLQESFHSQVYDGDNKEELLSVIRDNNTVNISNKPSLENKFEKDHEIESMKEGKGIKQLKSPSQQQSQLQINAQNPRKRGPSFMNDFQNNSNSCSLNIVKSFNQLDTDQGFISFRNEHSCSSQQEEGIAENFRSSHNSIDFDLKYKIKENIEKILKRQIMKKLNRNKAMKNQIFKQLGIDFQDYINKASFKQSLNKNNSSVNQNIGAASSSGIKLPIIPLLQSYQGSVNSHSSTLSSIMFPVQSNARGQSRGNNFYSYDFSNANKSFLSNDTLYNKKGCEEENNLRKAILEGFLMNQLPKGQPNSQQQNQKQKNKSNQFVNKPQNKESLNPPNTKLLLEKYNLQLPQNLSKESYKSIVNPLSTAPASLQFYQNQDSFFNSNLNNQQTLNNFDTKIPSQINISQSSMNKINSVYAFNNSNNNETLNLQNYHPVRSSKNGVSSTLVLPNQGSNNSNHTNNNYNNSTNSNNNNNNNNNNIPHSTYNQTMHSNNSSSNQQNNYFNKQQNNQNQTPINSINNSINNNNFYLNKSNQLSNIQSQPNSQQGFNQNMQSNSSMSNNSQINQQNYNSNYPSTPPILTGNSNVMNNTLNNNINTMLLNRISEECESPANTTYKQQQEYLNYESEQYLTGSKSQYHKKHQYLASGESNNTSSKPLEEGSSQQIQLFDKSHSSYNNDRQRIEKFSSPKSLEQLSNQQLQLLQNQPHQHLHQINDNNQNQLGNQNQITVFNLLNHTIANPNNLNQSHQQNPSANTSWLELSRSYEFGVLDDKARMDGQMLSFSKMKNAPSSHLSSQKSLHAIHSNLQNNQDNSDVNFMLNNLQNIHTNNFNPTQLASLNRVRSGENTPNDRDDEQHRFNNSQEIADALIGETNNEEIQLRKNINQQMNKKQGSNQVGGFHFPLIGKHSENNELKITQSSPQRFDQIIQSLTKSVSPYSMQRDLQEASASQQYHGQQIPGKERKSIDSLVPPYFSKFPSKISEEQSKMQSSGSNFNSSNNNFNSNVNQNKLMASSNQYSNTSQYLNTQYDNQNGGGGGGVIQSSGGDYINCDSSKYFVQNVISSNKQNGNLTSNTNNIIKNVNSLNNNFNSNHHNIHAQNTNFAISHRSSSSTSNSNYNFMESQGATSVERMSEPGQSIEIQIERRQNNHHLLIEALKKQLQYSRPHVLAEIEDHIRMHPHHCFILVLQEDQYQQTVLKGVFQVFSQSIAKKSYQIEDIPSTISLDDVEEFLKIDRSNYSFLEFDTQPTSFKKVEGVILKSQYS